MTLGIKFRYTRVRPVPVNYGAREHTHIYIPARITLVLNNNLIYIARRIIILFVHVRNAYSDEEFAVYRFNRCTKLILVDLCIGRPPLS